MRLDRALVSLMARGSLVALVAGCTPEPRTVTPGATAPGATAPGVAPATTATTLCQPKLPCARDHTNVDSCPDCDFCPGCGGG